MLRLVLTVLALALGALACDEAKLNSCVQSFRTSLKMPDSVKDATGFVAYVDQYAKTNGENGFVAICASASKVKGCEGDDFADCTSVKGLTGMGLSLSDSYIYAEFAAKHSYICGTGYDVYYNNYKCYSQIFYSAAYHTTDEKCIADYQSSVSKDPGNICKYNQVDITCRSTPFKTCNSDLANAFCQTNKAGFEATNIICSDKVTCTF